MRIFKYFLFVIFSVLFLLPAGKADARDTISIVGSSTVFPFATVVAEEYGRGSGNSTPVIESTGSGGGMKLFLQVLGLNILISQIHPGQSRKVSLINVKLMELI